jgi:hypothetical protein
MRTGQKILLIQLPLYIGLTYHLCGLWSEYAATVRDWEERQRFLNIPGISEYGFLSEILVESRDFVARGKIGPATARYIASLFLFRLAYSNPVTFIVTGMTLTFMFLWFVFGYLNHTYAVDSVRGEMQERNKFYKQLCSQQQQQGGAVDVSALISKLAAKQKQTFVEQVE